VASKSLANKKLSCHWQRARCYAWRG